VLAEVERRRRAAGVPVRVVIFDRKRTWTWARWDGRRLETEAQLLRALEAQGRAIAKGAREAPTVIVGSDLTNWRGFWKLPDVTWLVDEARVLVPKWASEKAPPGVLDVLTLGREPARQDWLIGSQRPTHMSNDVFANATDGWVLPLQDDGDIADTERGLGIDLSSYVWRPAPNGAYHPLHWVQRGRRIIA
jgi:hypothetical protein